MSVRILRREMRRAGVRRADDPKHQMAYGLFKSGLTAKEVAAQLGVPPGSASYFIAASRSKDPEPYYRKQGRRPNEQPR